MCTVGAVAIGMGAFQAFAGIQQAQAEADYANAAAEAKYLAAKRNAERNNQISEQNYQNQLRIATAKDEAKKEKHAADLKAYEAAILSADNVSRGNQLEANRASAKIAVERKQANAELAFESEKAVAAMIQEQGKMLSTGNAGQSFLLQTENPLKELSRTQAQLDEMSFLKNQAFGLDLSGVSLDYASAEWQNYNNIPAVPESQRASLMPFKPIKDPGPAKPIKRKANYWGAIAGGISGGLSAGSAMGGSGPAFGSGGWFNQAI